MTIAATLAQLGNFLKNGGTLDSATYLNAQAFTVGDDNILINPRCDFSSDIGTTLQTITNGSGLYGIDQWQVIYNHAAATAVIKSQQVAPIGSPAFGLGFNNSLQVTATTALTSPAAGDYFVFSQPLEGSRVARLGYGNAFASPSYVNFWINPTISGTATFSIHNNPSYDRSFISNFSVTGGAWNYISIPVPPDITGSWNKGRGIAGASFQIGLCGGTSFQGTNTGWQAGNLFATSTTTNFFATANNQVSITGASWYPGNTGPSQLRSPLVMRTEEMELLNVQRFMRFGIPGGAFIANTTTSADISIQHLGMYKAPTPKALAALGISNIVSGNYTQSAAGISIISNNSEGGLYGLPNLTGLTAGNLYQMYPIASNILLNARM